VGAYSLHPKHGGCSAAPLGRFLRVGPLP